MLALLVDVFSFLSYLSLHSRSTEVRLLYTLFTVILTHVVSCDSCLVSSFASSPHKSANV